MYPTDGVFPFGTNKNMVIPRIPHKNAYPHILTPNIYPLVNIQKNDGKPPIFMGKSTINHHDQVR